MKKLILFSLMFAFSVSVVLSQDIIYTVSGQFNDDNLSLDSILFENITNGSRILFDNLPENPDYQINLTKKQYWGTAGINSLQEESGFLVLQNIPGKLTLLYSKNTPTNVNVSVYNINGQKIYTSEKKILYANDIIKLELESVGVFIAKLESPNFVQSYKSIGGKDLNNFNVSITAGNNSKNSLKSAMSAKDADFSFEVGDSVRISTFISGYYAPPIELKVSNSQAVNFQFSKNFLEINNNEYVLSGGISIGYFGHNPSTLILFSSDVNFNFEAFKTDGTFEAGGIGAILDFEINYPYLLHDLESGTYSISIPEVVRIDTVCDIDVNADGILNEDDCFFNTIYANSYISPDDSFYDTNFDINDENYASELYFQSGSVVITKNVDFYTIEFTCIGINGDVIKGFFAGHFYYYNYSPY